MKLFPDTSALREHIDHYWIVQDAATVFREAPLVYAYPGITPEIILVLKGYLTVHYQGRTEHVDYHRLYSFLQQDIVLDMSTLESFVIIQFKSRALSSLLPFVKHRAEELMRQPICRLEDVIEPDCLRHIDRLHGKSAQAMVPILDEWLAGLQHDQQGGFLTELANELPAYCTPAILRERTGYSYATLERHFKRDTGLTPKRYHSLQRYKLAVQEIYITQNPDWQHYIHKYGYYDQSHFIKEIKRYTSFTPRQLLHTPGLLSYRP